MMVWLIYLAAVALKLTVILGGLMLVVAFMPYVERKVLGRIQIRQGPSHVGPYGVLQSIADAIKLMTKEDITPSQSIRPIYLLAPGVVAFTAMMTFAVIPFGEWTVHLSDSLPELAEFPLGYVTDLDLALLFVLAMSSLAVYGVAWGGWSSGSKYGLLGGLRASAQMISYELTLGLVILSAVMITGTLSLVDIVRFQAEYGWNVLYQPVAMVLFVVAMFAETNRLPFDLAEAESELTGGYHTEHSSMRFGLFFMGEYMHMIATSAICSLVFLGGWLPPFPGWGGWSIIESIPVLGAVAPVGWLLLKISFFMFLFIWVRGTFPRFRYDQLMKIGWKVLLEVAFVNLFIAALMRAIWPEPTWAWLVIQGLVTLIFLLLVFGLPHPRQESRTIRLEE